MFNINNAKLIATNLIIKSENLKLVAYQDSKGIWTIAIGIIKVNGKPIYEGMTCTREQAIKWCSDYIDNDIKRLTEWCDLNSIDLEDNQAGSILCFTYNAGFPAFKSSSMASEIINNNFELAAKAFEKWDKIRIGENLVFSRGLFNRRMREEKCFINEDDCQ